MIWCTEKTHFIIGLRVSEALPRKHESDGSARTSYASKVGIAGATIKQSFKHNLSLLLISDCVVAWLKDYLTGHHDENEIERNRNAKPTWHFHDVTFQS